MPLILVLVTSILSGALVAAVMLSGGHAWSTMRARVVRAVARLVSSRRPSVARDRPRPPVSARRRAALAAILALIVAVTAMIGAFVVMIRAELGLARSDIPLSEWAAREASDVGAEVLRAISLLGGTSLVIAVGLVAAGVVLGRGWGWVPVAFLAVAIGGQFAIVNVIKLIVERARPDLAQLTGYAGASFPSGHAAAAACVTACLAVVATAGRRRGLRALAAGLAVAASVAVALTRVLLGVHWLTDVIVGLAVGWAWTLVCWLAFDGPRWPATAGPSPGGGRPRRVAVRSGG